MQDFNDAFNDMIKNSQWKNKYYVANIKDDWEKIFGPLIAKYTEKLTLIRKKLYIEVSNSSLREELFNQKEKVIYRINNFYETEIVKEIILK